MKKVLLGTSIVLVLLGLVGCVTMPDGSKEFTPEIMDMADTIANIGSTVVVAGTPLSTLWPPASLLLGILGTIFGAWQNRSANTSYGITGAVVSAIGKYREKYPEKWDELAAELTKAIGPTAEGVIRKLRGLPPKK